MAHLGAGLGLVDAGDEVLGEGGGRHAPFEVGHGLHPCSDLCLFDSPIGNACGLGQNQHLGVGNVATLQGDLLLELVGHAQTDHTETDFRHPGQCRCHRESGVWEGPDGADDGVLPIAVLLAPLGCPQFLHAGLDFCLLLEVLSICFGQHPDVAGLASGVHE